jgi:glyoxylase-like metal-dependent hydrolase (beta-lactamase superfamily II)
MLKIRRLPVGQLQTNCYLVSAGEHAIIIDPGDDADYIQRIISDLEVKLTQIIATHAHYDHVLAVTELKLAYKIPFQMHKKDVFLLKRMRSSARHFSGISAGPTPKVDKYLDEGDDLEIGNCKLKIIYTPGHTPGSIALYSKELKIIFVGDVLFAGGGIGRTDFAYSNASDLENSIEKVLKLSDETVVYPGHGEDTIVEAAKGFFKNR